MITAEVFDHTLSSWNQIESSILNLEQEAFNQNAFTTEVLKEDFLNKDNIIVLLKDSSSVIGFTYAKPMEPETDDSPALPGETAWMWDTVIQKEYRGRKLLGEMMLKIEDELRKRGFRYLERNALIANNFAENIAKNYKDRIIKTFSLESVWGPQIFFRIKL